MYSVYALIDGNEICIYDDWSDAPELRIIDPQLELERNSSGSFTFTLPPTNIAYGTYILKSYTISGYTQDHTPIMQEHSREVDLIQRMATKIIIYQDMNETEDGARNPEKLWEGRVVSEDKDWYNQRMVTCEGDLAYFNDTCQKPALFGFAADITDDPMTLMTHVINYHNSKVDNSRTFELAADSTIVDSRIGEQKQYEITYQSTMEVIQDLVKTFGGVIQVYYVKETVGDLVTWGRKIRWDNADNIIRVGTLQPQTINFGKNLLDFKCTWDLSKLCTVAVPTGAKLENDGKDEIGEEFEMAGGAHSQWLYLDEDGKVYSPSSAGQTISDFRLEAYQTGVYNVDAYVQDCDAHNQERTVYISCRLTNNVVAYCTCSKTGWDYDTEWGDTQLSYLVASPDQGYIYQDFIDYKIVLPYGTKSIALCSYGDNIKMCVKRRKFSTDNTVTETALTMLSGSEVNKKLVYSTHEEAIPDTDPVEYETVMDSPTAIHYEDDDNYITRTYNFPSELIEQIDDGNGKIYVSGRSENGTIIFGVFDEADGLQREGGPGTLQQWAEANQSRANIQEFDHEEISLQAGARSITITGYRGGTSMPTVSYNRSESKVYNGQTPKEKYVTVETATTCPNWHETGSEYVINKSLIDKYGYIERILSFEDILDPNLLCQTAVAYLQNIAFDEMTIDISAIDLRALGATDVDYFRINDELRCVSEYHGLDKFLPITKLSIPLNKPENMKVTIGETTQESMSENTNNINQDLMDSIVTNRVMTLEIAKQNALSIMTEGDSGYVTLKRDPSGEHIKEIVFSSTVDPTESTNVWIWNQHGLCHSNHYPLTAEEEASSINTAITQDGSIVADFITAGTLKSILLSGTHAVFGVESTTGGANADGSILMVSNNIQTQSGKGKGAEFANGNIRYFDHTSITLNEGSHTYTINGEEEFGRIYGWSEDPTGKQLLSISAKILAINPDEIWIASDSIYDGGTASDAIGTYTSNNYHYVLRSDADLTGTSSPTKVYLPKSKSADPNDPNDWVECYVSDGVLVDSTSPSPTKAVGFRHGFAYEVT